MNRGIFFGLVLAAYALPTAGCGGDDDDDDGGDNGTGGNGTGGSMNVMCEPGAGGACQNETDCPKVVNGDLRRTAQTCGVMCQAEADPGACAVGCIVDEESSTPECSACYAALVGCAAENCLAECGADPAGAACNQCQIDEGCRGDFDDCSGLTTVPPQ
jgi:hypothetical protein